MPSTFCSCIRDLSVDGWPVLVPDDECHATHKAES
jgi:hypothetical protein